MRVVINAYACAWVFSIQMPAEEVEHANNIKDFAESNFSMHTMTKEMGIDFFADLRAAFNAMCRIYNMDAEALTVSAEILED